MSDAKEAVKGYLEAANGHDTGGALDHLHDEFELQFVKGPTLDKAAIGRAMGWDIGTEGVRSWRIVSETGDEVVVEGEETNQFLQLLGSEPLKFRSEFRVDDQGLIMSQRYEVEWLSPSVEESLKPAIAWADVHAPEELAEVYPDGKLVYTEAMGRRWVALLKAWRSSTRSE